MSKLFHNDGFLLNEYLVTLNKELRKEIKFCIGTMQTDAGHDINSMQNA
jgi:hypothetical protein